MAAQLRMPFCTTPHSSIPFRMLTAIVAVGLWAHFIAACGTQAASGQPATGEDTSPPFGHADTQNGDDAWVQPQDALTESDSGEPGLDIEVADTVPPDTVAPDATDPTDTGSDADTNSDADTDVQAPDTEQVEDISTDTELTDTELSDTVLSDITEPLGPCPPTADGVDCLFNLHAAVKASCHPDDLARLEESVLSRRGELPAWRPNEALFVSWGEAVSIAGAFNGWQPEVLITTPVCGSALHSAQVSLDSGRWPYKRVKANVWSLDPENNAFEFDDFPGNFDGRNNVLNTWDSGLGHLVRPTSLVCSEALGNCRPFTTYLPAGYGAPENAEKQYPVVFMHDGQNLWDHKTCCFGHTGWEINVRLDTDIAAGLIEPAVVVGFDHAGTQRAAEYANPESEGGLQGAFMAFQVETVQPAAFSQWRLDSNRVFVAGSSFGGLISFKLAFTYPNVYRGAATLSGSWWPFMGGPSDIFDFAESKGKVNVGFYLDHGGSAQNPVDGYALNIEMRDHLAGLGWQLSTAPACTFSTNALCYHHAVGATHDELAWRDRAHLFLRYFLPGPTLP